MCLDFRSASVRSMWSLAGACAIALIAPSAWSEDTGTDTSANDLRVCADPDNLPYSDDHERGFENLIAKIVADDLHRHLQYSWLPQRRGFVRKSMGEGLCDVFIGVPEDFERVLTTRAYYRSSYVFVTRAKEGAIDTFLSPQLKTQRIGVQLVGDDLEATPPGYALARAGAIDNVVGYTFYGDSPAAARMVQDLSAHRIDVALIWGPQAGYFAAHSKVPLTVRIAQPPGESSLPFEYSISMGVRKNDQTLQRRLNEALDRHQREIDAVLARFSVPRTDSSGRIAASME
jgi:mxaJ protein